MQKVKDAAVAEAAVDGKKEAKDSLLVLSKFLRAAAAKRQGGDETSAENRAFEGALLLVYGGEVGAVTAMESLIAGTEDKVPTVDQTPSDFTCESYETLWSCFSSQYRYLTILEKTSKFGIWQSSMLLTLRKKLGQRRSPSQSLSLLPVKIRLLLPLGQTLLSLMPALRRLITP